MRNARREAEKLLGPGFAARVLEPSPPAVLEGEFAEDPVARGQEPVDVVIVSPVHTGDRTWTSLLERRPELTDWAADRWLGAHRRLEPLPERFAETRHSLHVLAEHVLAKGRWAANGRIGLRRTHDGFGTPFFGFDIQLRVQGTNLVRQDRGGEYALALDGATPAQAAELCRVELGAPTSVYQPDTGPVDPDAPLTVDAAAAHALADFFGFTTYVLETVRVDVADASLVQLWPEHFDVAFTAPAPRVDAQVHLGGSPGDEQHTEPYLYLAPQGDPGDDEFWNAEGFRGAQLSYRQLLDADDQIATAVEFLRRGLALLT